jgi:hypothetical protein
MLDSHPELIVYPEESHFFRRFLPGYEAHPEKSIEEHSRENLLHIFEWNLEDPPAHQNGFPDRDYSAIDTRKVQSLFGELFRQHNGGSEQALPSAMFSYGIATGQVTDRTKYWVEKTPYNEHYAQEIFESWSNAKCLHIVRDPRDNYASYKRKQTEWEPEHFAYSWWKSISMGQKNVKRFGPARYLMIKYEDLVQDTETTIRDIVMFIGIEDDPILRRPTRAGGLWMGNSMFGDSFRKISATPTGRYLEHLDRAEIQTLESLLKPEMIALDYAITESQGNSDQLISQFKRIKWRLLG